MTTEIAERVFPTLTEPLRARDQRDDHELFTRPLSELLATSFASDLMRGIVATDGLIGTFASAASATTVSSYFPSAQNPASAASFIWPARCRPPTSTSPPAP